MERYMDRVSVYKIEYLNITNSEVINLKFYTIQFFFL